MASDQQSSFPPCYNVILLGKTGSGKSAVGNTLLREKAFISKKSSKGVTEEVQKKSVTFEGVTLHVYDTPGLFDPERSNNDDIIKKWESLLQLDESLRTVFLLVIKADRFTPEEKESVDLIVEFIPDWLLPNTWILFTRGDELEREELTIEEFIEDTEGLKEIVQRFEDRYHVFNNFSKRPEQVRELVNKIKESPKITPPEMGFPRTTPSDSEADPVHRRIMVLGKTGVGKSASGNTILGEKRFRSELSSSSITSQCEISSCEVVLGRKVSVIDTPGVFDNTKSPEELGMEMGRSIYLSSPGPHAFLYVQPVNVKFTEQEENVIQKLEQIFGKEMKKYTIILFTHGDQLEGKSVNELIEENKSLKRIVDECKGRYHIFNNKHMRNRKEQVSELLQKIDRIVEENGESCYSNEMYEEAARLRREEETERLRKEEEMGMNKSGRSKLDEEEKSNSEGLQKFLNRNRSTWLIAGGVCGGGILSGVIIGAVVGTAFAGPVGAGIGAKVGACFGTGTGFLAGGIGTSLHGKNHGERSKSSQRESTTENTSLERGTESAYTVLEEDSSETSHLIADSNLRHRRSRSRFQN